MVGIIKVLLLALTVSAASIYRRDAVTVQDDINQKIAPQIATLQNDVNGYPASGLSGALAIHTDIQNLGTIVNGATVDVKSTGAFSEADGTSILAAVQALVPTLLNTLSTLVAQKQAWADIPGGQALLLSDLQSLNTTFTGFLNAVIAASPADLVPSATSVKTQVDGGFSQAIAAYST
jgi:hypothetical protein